MLRSLRLISIRSCFLTGNSVRKLATVSSGLKDDTPTTAYRDLLVASKGSEFRYLDGTVVMKDAEGSIWRYPKTTKYPTTLSYADNHLDAAKNSAVIIDENGEKAIIRTVFDGSKISRVVMVGKNQAIDADFSEEIRNSMMDSIRSWIPRIPTHKSFDPCRDQTPMGDTRDLVWTDLYLRTKSNPGILKIISTYVNTLSEEDRKAFGFSFMMFMYIFIVCVKCYMDPSSGSDL